MGDGEPDRQARRPVVIGLLGGVGSGKSTVARLLGEAGAVVFDADKRARALLDESDVKTALISWWGDDVLDDAGRVDRASVAAIVFDRPGERTRLESLIHPLVIADQNRTIEQARADGAPAVVIDAPLLMEAGMHEGCDTLIYVDAPLDVRLERVRAGRGWGAGELERRESAQIALEIKRAKADDVVQSDVDLDDLSREVHALFRQIMHRHGSERSGPSEAPSV